MPEQRERCLDDATAAGFVEGSLATERAIEVEAHIDGCAECRRWISGLAAAGPSQPAATTAAASAPPRYRIDGRLGAGGMGVVYRAFDTQLERHVALKLLRAADGSHDRLLREGRALARLRHPNVVTVHDVGAWDDQLYLAMELVEGTTLRRWCAETARTPREVLARFVAAGRGLAAAHAAGLVHGDFKPDNVLCGRDGRVCVADFGLARIDAGEAREAAAGTPAYMAPEQHRGEPAGARSDQFAFCVALHEALAGSHPFARPGDDRAALADRLRTGARVAPQRELPRRVRRAIDCGLAIDPGERSPSIDALLGALERRPWYAQRAVLAGVAVGIVTAAVAGSTVLRDEPPACPGAEPRLAGAWDPQLRAAGSAAFAGAGAFGAAAWQRVEANLDAWARAYLAMHVEVCEATHVRREQSAALMDRRVACLETQRRTIAAFTALLGSADRELIARAPSASSRLADVAGCLDPTIGAEPPTAGMAPAIDEARTALAQVEVQFLAGRYAEARAAIAPLVSGATALGYRPLQAEVLYRQGTILHTLGELPAAERAYLAAAGAAGSSRHDAVAARALIALVASVGGAQGRLDEGDRLATLAAAAVERVALSPGGPELRAALLRHTGTLRARQARYDEALALMRQSLALAEPTRSPDVPLVLDGIGTTLETMGKLDDAGPIYERAIAIRERDLGAAHPDLSYSLENLAILACKRGACADGLPSLERALALVEAALGRDSLRAGQLLGTLGSVQQSLDHSDAAAAAYRRAIAIAERAQGDRHPELARHMTNLAATLRAKGELDEAARLYERALAIKVAAYGEDHPSTAATRLNLGVLLHQRGDDTGALAQHERALAVYRARLGDDHPNTGLAHLNVAIALRALHRAREALPHVERALAIAERDPAHAGLDVAKEELAALRR